MPLLALISGYVFVISGKGFGGAFLRKRAVGLLVPYVAWLFVAWALVGVHTWSGLLVFLGSAALDPQAPGALWFLYALFVSAVLLAGVMRLGGSDAGLVLSAGIVGVAGMLPLGPYSNLFGLSDVAWLYPFVVAGVLLMRHRSALFGARILPVAALVVWAASLPLLWPVVIPGPRWWYADVTGLVMALGLPAGAVVPKLLWAVVRVIGALAGSYGVFRLGTALRGRALDAASWLGRRTLGVYASHSYILLALASALAALVPWARLAVLFTAGLGLSVGLTLSLERVPIARRVFLGIRG
jgi:fucose 4-O-acetylase-like acetyltransferase